MDSFTFLKNKKNINEEQKLFLSYLVNWVAGVKLIFLFLLAVILAIGTEPVRMWAVIAMILSIATYFWRLHPINKKLDAMGCITPGATPRHWAG